MTEPTRDALHAATLARLEGDIEWEDSNIAELDGETDEHWQKALADSRKARAEYAYAAECVRVRAEMEAEVARLRAKAAIVDAMDSGRIAAFSKRKDGRVALYTPEHLQDFDSEPFVADTILAAYAAATREGKV